MSVNHKETLLASANELCTAIESDDDEQVKYQMLSLLNSYNDSQNALILANSSDIFEKLSINPKVTQLRDITLPKAKTRLEYITSVTEEASHKTLATVEDEAFPLIESIKQGIAESQFPSKESALDLIMELNATQQAFSSIMQAQEFQDLTGQVILQLYELIEEVETTLSQILSVATEYNISLQGHDYTPETDPLKAEGPQIGKENHNALSKQEDVDDLLSNLGI